MTNIRIVDSNIKYLHNGKLHRTDGPAEIFSNGTIKWYLNDNLHREDGPSQIFANDNDDKTWSIDNEYHRTDGPAIECTNGNFEYYINGKRHRLDGPAYKDTFTMWGYKAGNKLETTEPYIYKWYVNGVKHRLDGPAEICPYNNSWYVYGKLHREDGPAIKLHDGEVRYFLCGVEYKLENYLKLVRLDSLI